MDVNMYTRAEDFTANSKVSVEDGKFMKSMIKIAFMFRQLGFVRKS